MLSPPFWALLFVVPFFLTVNTNLSHKYHMRFYEFAIKPIKPITPPQAQINALKKQNERAITALIKSVNIKYLFSGDGRPLRVVSTNFQCTL